MATTQTAVFYGSSDDLIEVEGVKGADEFGVYVSDGRYHGSFNLGGQMRIHAIYDGCWSFAVGQVGEDIPLPDWPIRILAQPGTPYSMRLEIDVPKNAKVFQECGKD